MTRNIARTIPEWEAHVGQQIRELRLRAERTQQDVADAANISVSALSLLERGHGTSLATLIAVVRALGRSDWLDTLAPPQEFSPLAALEARRQQDQKRRQRGRRQTASATPGGTDRGGR